MSDKQKTTSSDRTKTNAFRSGFMIGYTNDNPASDASMTGFYAGYTGSGKNKSQDAQPAAKKS